MVPLTLPQLSKIAPNASAAILNVIYPPLMIAMEKYAINTKLRVAHFLAQVLHESGEFRYMQELASGQAYEGRKDLGNTYPGDGMKYKGRGLIQLTGRKNYQTYSTATGVNFVVEPTLVKEPKWATDVAGWYWKINGLNAFADANDINIITKRINGGYNGLELRKAYLTKAKLVLGI